MAATRNSARVQRTHSSITVVCDDGVRLPLPNLWLRDNCACSDCRVQQTSEKRFMIGSVAADLAPREVRLDGDRLRLSWPDGHVTRYSVSAIRGLRAARHERWQPWPANFTPAQVPWDGLLAGGDPAIEGLSRFLVDGTIVIAGAPCQPGTLEQLTQCLGPMREMEFARIHNVVVDSTGYNVAHTAHALPPHNDFASCLWPPSVQALHMLVNDTRGGDSIIVDGFALLEQYRADHPHFFDCLCRVNVPFSMFDDDTTTYARAPLIRCDSDGNITGLRFSNQLMQCMDPTRENLAQFYRAYHELCRRVMDTRFRVSFRLEPGHILLVAAHRVMHAREAFEPRGRRHLQDAYFEHENIANRLLVMRRKKEGDQ